MEADMVTILAYVFVVAILFLAVAVGIAIASLLFHHEESPDIDLCDVEEPFVDGHNPEQEVRS
jgi:hypothetical protein